MGIAILRARVGFGSASISRRIKVSLVFPVVVFRGLRLPRRGTWGNAIPLLPGRILSSNVLSLTDAVERSMDFNAKLEQARTLADVFELVKRAVEAVLGRTRAGLMVAVPDLGDYPVRLRGGLY